MSLAGRPEEPLLLAPDDDREAPLDEDREREGLEPDELDADEEGREAADPEALEDLEDRTEPGAPASTAVDAPGAGADPDRVLDRAESRRLDRAESKRLLSRLSELTALGAAAVDGGAAALEAERADVRDRLVRLHMPLVEHLARRFRNRGEPLDDLVQVATIGLLKSIDRYDPERGVEFSTYATPTIVGEVKRHFRDKGWAVRVPRRLQELRLQLTGATAALSQDLGRAPTVAELARHLGLSEEEVLEGLESANAYSTLSLDAPDSGDDERPSVADTLGDVDEQLEGVEYRESLRPLLAQLPDREKKILMLRFFGGMTQSQIAEQVGISQMHVSRLLARTLAQLREGLLQAE